MGNNFFREIQANRRKHILISYDFLQTFNKISRLVNFTITNQGQKNILRLVVRKSPTGESTHYFLFMVK